MNRLEWLALFSGKKAAKQCLAKHVFEGPQREEFVPTKCATELPFVSPPPNNTTSGAKIFNHRGKESNDIKKLKSFNFTRSRIKKTFLTENTNHRHPLSSLSSGSEGYATNVNVTKNPSSDAYAARKPHWFECDEFSDLYSSPS